MGKYNLGNASTEITGIDKDNLYINDSKAKSIEKDMQKQLEIMRSSLLNISSLLNRTVTQKVVTGKRSGVYKGWARKSKTQASAAEKVKTTLTDKYAEDLQNYPIKLLDERIAELEKKIASIINE